MKTAMQELIEAMESVGWKFKEEMKSELLEKEKQQIIEAYNCGENMMDAEQYYDKTFS